MKTRRVLAAIATGAVAVLTLTGCISVEMKIDVHSNDTASGSVAMSFDKSVIGPLIAMQGGSADDVCGFLETEMEAEATTSEDSEVKWSETNEACVMTTTSKAAIAFDENGLKDNLEGADGMQIVKQGTSATVTFPAAGFTDGLGDLGAQGAGIDQVLNAFTLQVNFPGAVSNASHNGKISGNSVTWDLAALIAASEGSDADMTATGSLIPAAGGNLMMIVGIVVLLLLIAAAVVFFLMRRNKGGAAPAAPAAPTASEAPSAAE